jgi:hypothetical protein
MPLASLRQATRLAGECPDPQQIGRESLDGEEGEPPELKYTATAGPGTGREHRAGEGASWSRSWHQPPTGGWMLSPY